MGTVTFLFTDVEGSTDLVRALGDETYSTLLAIHRRLLRDAFRTHHGHEIDTQGDAFFVAFADAADAIAAAVSIQQAVHRETWPGDAPVRVRMGVHTGDAVSTGTGYVGMDVHRAARISAAGYGGQILLSQTTRDAVANRLPPQVTLRLLGRYRLKDLQVPEALYQLVHPDLPVAFAPPRSLDAIPNNLPVQLTSFIGRDREIADVQRLFSNTRLLTLTGPGGCGKTRLAIQAAAELLDEFADGVWLVELAALTDPGLVTQATASVLGIREEPGRPLAALLADTVRSRRLLLILDNCEHLIDASARLAESLLLAGPGLKVLTTGREPLGIAGEMIYRVPSLTVPGVSSRVTRPDLNKTEATRLFIERAAFARPDLRLTDADAPAVARICMALDGIPLAIEMAAARLNTLSVAQIAQRISDRFGLLTGGSRTALPRQQTLQAMLDWSYELLTDAERAVLRALSVFPAGFTLEAAEDVGAGPRTRRDHVLHLVGQLVDKSMLVADTHADDARYRMLQIVRQYGLERLVQAGEAGEVRARQLAWCLRLVASLNIAVRPDHEWVRRLDVEHDNLRTGLAWGLEGGNVLSVLRLASSLAPFWLVRGYWSEGRRWLEAALTAGLNVDPDVQARGLLGLARIAEYQGDYSEAKTFSEAGLALQQHLGDSREVAGALRTLGNIAYARSDYSAARTLYEESLTYGRAAGDPRVIAASLINLAIVADHQADYARAAALCRESLDLFRSVDDRRGTAFALHVLGLVAIDQGNHDGAAPMFEESLQLRRDLGDQRGISGSLHSLGVVARAHGDLTRAQALHEESLDLRRTLGDKQGVGASLGSLAVIARDRGDLDGARALWQESLTLRQSIGDQAGIAECLEHLAAIASNPTDAVHLFGAAAAVRETIVAPGSLGDQETVRREIERLRARLDDDAFDAAWREGRRMPQNQAIGLALATSGEAP
ncbi:MAG TPA: tetratricopeptide repeat protein [bacterium]|jgi:predicted ATPase/class 3 adenylate cyclase|nr:tetratricopeptide repeat protein [bacterium]